MTQGHGIRIRRTCLVHVEPNFRCRLPGRQGRHGQIDPHRLLAAHHGPGEHHHARPHRRGRPQHRRRRDHPPLHPRQARHDAPGRPGQGLLPVPRPALPGIGPHHRRRGRHGARRPHRLPRPVPPRRAAKPPAVRRRPRRHGRGPGPAAARRHRRRQAAVLRGAVEGAMVLPVPRPRPRHRGPRPVPDGLRGAGARPPPGRPRVRRRAGLPPRRPCRPRRARPAQRPRGRPVHGVHARACRHQPARRPDQWDHDGRPSRPRGPCRRHVGWRMAAEPGPRAAEPRPASRRPRHDAGQRPGWPVGQRHAGHAGGVRFRRCGRRPPGLRRGGIHRQAPLAHGPQPARRREGGAGRGRHLHPAAAPAGMGRHHPQKPGPHARPHAFGAARMAAAHGRAGVRRAEPREDAGGTQPQPAADIHASRDAVAFMARCRAGLPAPETQGFLF